MRARSARSVSGKTYRIGTRGTELQEPCRDGQGADIYSDEYCPHCDNHFVLEAKTPSLALNVEGEDVRVDSRMLKDERVKADAQKTIWDIGDDAVDKMG